MLRYLLCKLGRHEWVYRWISLGFEQGGDVHYYKGERREELCKHCGKTKH